MITNSLLYDIQPDGSITIPTAHVAPLSFIFNAVGFSLDEIKDAATFEAIWANHIGFRIDDLMFDWLKSKPVSLERNALMAALLDSDDEFERMLSLLNRRNAIGLKVINPGTDND
ncbi:MAG: hypothetical protein H6999_00410 [Hahellaceae bacterium]|nr:hypothetical protein [Hahellaceae bacterium]MCP5168212.1 hypothetical protein [Hahellaceae bacterium]